MSNTGYSDQRSEPHEKELLAVAATLRKRGYECTILPPDGHRPDGKLKGRDYIDIKTGSPNIAIELDAWNEYRRIETTGGRVYIIWRNRNRDWLVFTVSTLVGGIIRGPRRHHGNGSNDDWYLISPLGRGTKFDDFFPTL